MLLVPILRISRTSLEPPEQIRSFLQIIPLVIRVLIIVRRMPGSNGKLLSSVVLVGGDGMMMDVLLLVLLVRSWPAILRLLKWEGVLGLVDRRRWVRELLLAVTGVLLQDAGSVLDAVAVVVERRSVRGQYSRSRLEHRCVLLAIRSFAPRHAKVKNASVRMLYCMSSIKAVRDSSI